MGPAKGKQKNSVVYTCIKQPSNKPKPRAFSRKISATSALKNICATNTNFIIIQIVPMLGNIIDEDKWPSV